MNDTTYPDEHTRKALMIMGLIAKEVRISTYKIGMVASQDLGREVLEKTMKISDFIDKECGNPEITIKIITYSGMIPIRVAKILNMLKI